LFVKTAKELGLSEVADEAQRDLSELKASGSR
jgi:hypothetical protein